MAKAKVNPFAKYKLSAVPAKHRRGAKSASFDPLQKRRDTFLEKFRWQRELWNDPTFTVKERKYRSVGDGTRKLTEVETSPKPWWVIVGDKYVITLKYGVRDVVLYNDLVASEDMTKEEMEQFFDDIEQAVNEGYFDEEFKRLGSRKKG